MSLDPFKNTIHTWLKNEIGEQLSGARAVIWAEESGPRPKRPYATLKLVTPSQKQMGRDNIRQRLVGVAPHQTAVWCLNGPRRMFVDVNVFGSGAIEMLTIARDGLDDPEVISYFAEAGMQVEDEGHVSNETVMLESEFQEQARMSMIFGFTFERDLCLREVAQLEISGTLNFGGIAEVVIDGKTYNVGS